VGALVSELNGQEGDRRTLVFVRTKRGADRLVKKLSQQKVHAIAMHGNKSQGQRRRALASFESGHIDTLVATDVASRGIDVDDITHVINFDMPEDRDAYVHRTGRTGRAGRNGEAASFVLPDQFREMRAIAVALGLTREFDSAPGAGNGRSQDAVAQRSNGHRSNGHGSNGRGPRASGGRNGRNRRRQGNGHRR
jgi:ATP-dependent RNA helicase RhlE